MEVLLIKFLYIYTVWYGLFCVTCSAVFAVLGWMGLVPVSWLHSII